MPQSLTPRLATDEEFRKKIAKVVKDYVNNARETLDYYSADYDAAHDTLSCYANLSKKDYVALAKGNPRRFTLPMTATHIHTMTTFLAQVLYGDTCPHKVDAGSPDSDGAARLMNELLRWNSEQQAAGIYQLGWMWIESALTYNRGVMYDCYAPILKSKWQNVPKVDEAGQPVLDENQQPVLEAKKVSTKIGDYARIELVSPYDFYMDPLMPIYRMQEGRFAGHRMTKTWNELKARSELPENDPMFLSPYGIEQLKKKVSKGLGYPATGNNSGAQGQEVMSRTAYERARVASPSGSRADSKDPGMVDFVELWVRLVPKDYEIDERTDPEVFQIIVGNEKEPLACNESTYEHGMFPYSVGEARPSPFYQFSPSWVMLLSSLQNYVDYLKNRHQEAITRTIGNVFIAKSRLIDIADFEDPEKEGKFISILPEGENMPINDVIKQVPMVDMTAGFLNEMKGFISFAESTSGANQNLQGQTSGGSTTATEFASTQQMAAGRLSAIARLLSVGGIVPQTKRITSNFQQFYDAQLIRNIVGEDQATMDEFSDGAYTISNDTIQGIFTYRAHDGALPGPDAKKVAALSRTVEVMQTFPAIFQPGEGNLDPRRIFIDLFRVSGMQPEKYRWRPQDIAKAQAQMQAAEAAEANKPKEILPIKPAMSITAKIEELTASERYQIMKDVGVEETGLGGPIPDGMLQPHPGGTSTIKRAGHRASTHGGGGHGTGKPGPAPGLSGALMGAKGARTDTAEPVAARPGNT